MGKKKKSKPEKPESKPTEKGVSVMGESKVNDKGKMVVDMEENKKDKSWVSRAYKLLSFAIRDALLVAIALFIIFALFTDCPTAWGVVMNNGFPVLAALLIFIAVIYIANIQFSFSQGYFDTKKKGYKIGFVIISIFFIFTTMRTIGREYYLPYYFSTNTPTQIIVIQTKMVIQTVEVTPSIMTSATNTPTPEVAPDQADIYKKAIRAVIEQLLSDWDKEIFPVSWDENVTDNYKERYFKLFGNEGGIANFFGNTKRMISSELEFEWRNNGTEVLVSMTIYYGENNPRTNCKYWFLLIKDNEKNIWLIETDKTIATPGLPQICPE
jgi:hypothetical protein